MYFSILIQMAPRYDQLLQSCSSQNCTLIQVKSMFTEKFDEHSGKFGKNFDLALKMKIRWVTPKIFFYHVLGVKGGGILTQGKGFNFFINGSTELSFIMKCLILNQMIPFASWYNNSIQSYIDFVNGNYISSLDVALLHLFSFQNMFFISYWYCIITNINPFRRGVLN